MWIEYNPNPTGRRVEDCAVRAVARALDTDWETAYSKIALAGFNMGDMPHSNSVWGAVLRQNGFYRTSLPDTCPDCYTAEDFINDHPEGVCTYIAMFYDQNNLGQLVYRVLYFNFMKDGQSNIKFTLYIIYLILPGICVLYSLAKLGKLYDEEYLRHLLVTIVFNTFGIMILYFVIATLFAYAWAMLLAAICLGVAYIIGYMAVQDAIAVGESKQIKNKKKQVGKKKED